ncbi:MAG: hypothetical protein S0880_36750 [Actinomycetota bacterium]|nr:hypothetical protein [Actinomycetota bacterium]
MAQARPGGGRRPARADQPAAGGSDELGAELVDPLFDVLDRNGTPVPRWTRTIVVAGLRFDLVR